MSHVHHHCHQKEAPERVPRLHQRASEWFAAHALVEDAVRHALAAEDFDRGAHLMEEALPDLRRARRDGLMLAWVRALPEPVVRRSPVCRFETGEPGPIGWGILACLITTFGACLSSAARSQPAVSAAASSVR